MPKTGWVGLPRDIGCRGANPSIAFGAKTAIVSTSGQAYENQRTNACLSELENVGKSLFFGIFSMSTEKDPDGIEVTPKS